MSKIETVRHSLAHIMALAVKNLFKEVKFGIGPVIENGFYYDFGLPRSLTPAELPKIEKEMKRLIKENLSFKKSEMKIEEAIKFFKNEGQNYKVELLDDLQKEGEEKISLYETGEFIDLCRGPHVVSTKEINLQGFKLTKIAGAYWRGDEKNPMLQRIYGVAFENKKELDGYLNLLEEAEKRDHRKIGKTLDLFSFHDIAPNAVFWHPRGMIIVNELQNFIRKLQEEYGYLETSTPVLAKKKLYEISGHLDYYQENIFSFEISGDEYALKPMNCPENTYIYGSKVRSYRDLPLRFSEFGLLYRKERSGTLSGLFRAYGFIQDDAHIYCTQEQIQEEISKVLELIKKIHSRFDLSTLAYLATRPDKFMGEKKLWDKAEKALEFSLKKNKLPYQIREKDGSFYGPKIDIEIEDSLKRNWAIATVQLDFQMPERFSLEYIDEKGKKKRPVMIHRSSIGSFERFIGVILEHYAGALPFWLSPVQILILPIGKAHLKYAEQIYNKLSALNFRVELNSENETLGKKIREGEIQKIPYILVIGEKEVKEKKINVRKRDDKSQKSKALENFIKSLQKSA